MQKAARAMQTSVLRAGTTNAREARRTTQALATGALASTAMWAWFPAWIRCLEIGWAAPQVIAHRSGRMLRSGPFPGAVDRAEFHRMFDEKAEAWFESATNATAQFWQTWFEITAWSMQAWWAAPGANPWGGDAWRSVYRGAARRWARSAPRIAFSALGPVHRRATANARRLAR